MIRSVTQQARQGLGIPSVPLLDQLADLENAMQVRTRHPSAGTRGLCINTAADIPLSRQASRTPQHPNAGPPGS